MMRSHPAPTLLVFVLFCLLVLFSWQLGPDTNWDLLNYHYYNPWALLHHRSGLDVAPAGMQTWFNPLQDLYVYLLNQRFVPQVAGVLLGATQALALPFLFLALRWVLPLVNRSRVLFLAFAGVWSSAFVGELGTGMGDATSATVVMLAVWLLLGGMGRQRAGWLLVAGGVAGAAVGLKLTNAVSALAMLAALWLALPTYALRWRNTAAVLIGMVLGFALVGGPWLYRMWVMFGNPLFPQFSSLFPSPWVPAGSIADTRYLPHGAVQHVLWPLIGLWSPAHIAGDGFAKLLWPLWWLVLVWWLMRRRAGAVPAEQRFVLWYVGIGFYVWASVFGIYRYLAQIELLLPAALYVLWLGVGANWRWLRRVLVLSMLMVLLESLLQGGRADWSDRLFRISPDLVSVKQATVVLVGQPTAYLATQMATSNVYVLAHPNFAVTGLYNQRVRAALVSRSRAVAIIPAVHDWRADNVRKANHLLEKSGWLQQADHCRLLKGLLDGSRAHARFAWDTAAQQSCHLAETPDDALSVEKANNPQNLLPEAAWLRQNLGVVLMPGQCRLTVVYNGSREYDYQLCDLGKVLL